MGVELAFCVPGESYLAVLDALYDAREQVQLIVCRQEGGGSVYGGGVWQAHWPRRHLFRYTWSRATNASIGVHTAYQDSSPMILFIGPIGSDVVEREAFQEVDDRRMYGQMAKWVAQVDRADRIPEYVSHAFHLAVSGRPGPVVLALPEDMLISRAVAAQTRPYHRVKPHASPQALGEATRLPADCGQAFVILGGGD
jgi:acetolactate synthase-1/2/3 large subunit